MGSTSSVRKAASALIADDGKIYYGLFEQTYEHNVYPQTPHWGCIFFGDAASCMSRIIDYASNCEGGMLKENGSWVTPSAYIKHWREALAKPTLLRIESVRCENGKGFYYTDAEKQASIAKSVEVANRFGLDFVDGVLTLDLKRQAHILQALLEARVVTPWRILNYADAGSLVQEFAAYVPEKPAGVDVPDIQVWRITPEGSQSMAKIFALDNQGEVLYANSDYYVMENLITTFAKASELKFPGSAEAAIRQLRKLVEKDVKQMPKDQVIRITRSKAENEWQSHQLDCLLNKMQKSGDELITTLAAIEAVDGLYKLECCGEKMISLPGLHKRWEEKTEASQPDLLATC